MNLLIHNIIKPQQADGVLDPMRIKLFPALFEVKNADKKKFLVNSVLILIVLISINFRFVPVTAQDIVTSDDISNGASVFVFPRIEQKTADKIIFEKNFRRRKFGQIFCTTP